MLSAFPSFFREFVLFLWFSLSVLILWFILLFLRFLAQFWFVIISDFFFWFSVWACSEEFCQLFFECVGCYVVRSSFTLYHSFFQVVQQMILFSCWCYSWILLYFSWVLFVLIVSLLVRFNRDLSFDSFDLLSCVLMLWHCCGGWCSLWLLLGELCAMASCTCTVLCVACLMVRAVGASQSVLALVWYYLGCLLSCSSFSSFY